MTAAGNASTFEPVPSRRDPHPVPTIGYRIGVRHDGVVVQAPYPGEPLFVLPVSAGTHGGAWCGTYLPSNQSVALGAPPRPVQPPFSSYRQKNVTRHPVAGPESTPLFVLPVKTGTHGGVTAGGNASTFEPVPGRRYPHPVPTMGTASECGTTVWRALPLVVPAEAGTHGGVTAGGNASTFEPVPSRRDPYPVPTMGTASGCGHDDNFLRLTGENRYPWWGDKGGPQLRRAGP